MLPKGRGLARNRFKERPVKIEAARNQINELLVPDMEHNQKGLDSQAVLLPGCGSKILKELKGPVQCPPLVLTVLDLLTASEEPQWSQVGCVSQPYKSI